MTLGRSGRMAVAACLLGAALGGAAHGQGDLDPLAVELSRWSRFLSGHAATDDTWKQVKEGSEPALARADKALRDGRRLLAVLRLASVREGLYAAGYMADRTAEQRRDTPSFEAEWKRMGAVMKDDLARTSAPEFTTVRPVALRAMAEVAWAKVPVYYNASLEYGRNTTPDSGLYYLGAAEAQRDFIDLARKLSVASAPAPPPIVALEAGLDGLQSEVLAAYRPPASVEKHPEFITVSSLVKEARELAAAGARYGALLRYLQAAMRFGGLREGAVALDAPTITTRLQAFDPRLDERGVDHTIARLLVEAAQADLAEHATDGGAIIATSIARDVLPRYFAVLAPSPPKPRAPDPKVAVTLVRWPYT